MRTLDELMGRYATQARSFGNNVTLGALPNLAAAPMWAYNQTMGDGTMGYGDAVQAARGVIDEGNQRYPQDARIGEVGAMLTGMPIANAGMQYSRGVAGQLQELMRAKPAIEGLEALSQAPNWVKRHYATGKKAKPGQAVTDREEVLRAIQYKKGVKGQPRSVEHLENVEFNKMTQEELVIAAQRAREMGLPDWAWMQHIK